jgi:5-aminolevulinate synthase
VAATKAALTAAGLPLMPTQKHIVPILVGNADLCKKASDLLRDEHGIYIQPINYPTVPRGTERLRITPTPFHNDALAKDLTSALVAVWNRLDLPLFTDSKAEPPRVAAAGNVRVAVFPPAGG